MVFAHFRSLCHSLVISNLVILSVIQILPQSPKTLHITRWTHLQTEKAEERISEYKGVSVKIIQSKNQREKILKENEQSLSELDVT